MLKCMATLLKSHFSVSVLLYICCIFSEHILLITPLEGRFLLKNDAYFFANYQYFAIIIFIYFPPVDCTERGGYCSGRGTCVGNYFNHKCICEFGYIPTNDDAPDCVKGISTWYKFLKNTNTAKSILAFYGNTFRWQLGHLE